MILTGRKFLLILLAGFILVFATLVHFLGEKTVWEALDIPTHHPSFIDLRGVLTGLDAARLGFDPIFENPLDPYDRPVVYPRIWLAAGWLGLTEKHTEQVALLLLAVYAISLFVGLKSYDRTTAVWMALVICSPAALMCYRFANLDLVIFILLAWMLTLDRYSIFWSIGLLELAAFLKLFPIVGLGYLLKEEQKRFFQLFMIGLGVFALYLILTWNDTLWILGHAPKGALENYGIGVVAFRVYEVTNSRLLNGITTIPFYIISYAILFAALYFSNRYKGKLSIDDNQFIDAFRIGALIYLATFIQGNSFNYRFIFLVFAIPQLALWTMQRKDLQSVAVGTLVFLILSCWGMVLTKILPINLGFALDEIANWGLFFSLFYMFLISSPAWIRAEISSFFIRHQRLYNPKDI